MGLITLKIDDVYEVDIEALENEGAGVCKVNGMIVFVPKTLVGEKARIRITQIKKNFARGKLIEIINESENRIKQRCPYYEECGGCDLRHQNKKGNLQFKKEKVQTALKRIGKLDVLVDDVIDCYKDDHYRNKASFKVEGDRIGFYGQGTYQLVDVENCLLMKQEINGALKVIRNYLKDNQNDVKTITIKHGNAMNELLIDIYSTSKKDIKIKDYLLNNIDDLKTIIFNGEVVHGNGYISQIINGLMFNCSSKSFFQVNDVQTEKLYKTAIALADLKKTDVVLDLYCGTGTIASLVSSHVKKVIGVDIVPDAIVDAKCNAVINNLNNVNYICGDATKKVSKIREKVDVIFVDPPRAGMDRKAVAIIKTIAPKKMVYISCNPVTLARDLGYLNDAFDVEKIAPVDMFPQTSHVECVCVLNRH